MNKGSVPIPYIIALLLGIAVVAILGYWFFVLGGQWGGEATLETCRTRAHTYCASWQNYGFTYDTTCEPEVGWFGDRYPVCLAYETALGFTRTCDAGGSEDAAACLIMLGGGGNGGPGPGPGPTLPQP